MPIEHYDKDGHYMGSSKTAEEVRYDQIHSGNENQVTDEEQAQFERWMGPVLVAIGFFIMLLCGIFGIWLFGFIAGGLIGGYGVVLWILVWFFPKI